MVIAAGILIAWPSTVASIPSGWTRDTQYDAKYIQGAPAGGDADFTARGSATHTHTSPSHTPTQNSHLHVMTSTSYTAPLGPLGGGTTALATSHAHNNVNSATATATNNGVAITVDANTSNNLAYQDVIWIKSDGTPTGIPVSAYAFFASDTLPTGWTRVTQDYLKGAAASGNGGATGGSNTHTHTSPAHTHSQNAHTHAATASGTPNATATPDDSPIDPVATSSTHTHSVSLNSVTAVNQSVTTTMDTVNHEPLFKRLNIISNGNAGADLPLNIICLWGGTHAGIPASWSRYTALDTVFAKGTSADGQVGNTGGSTTHTHTAANCQPTQNAHSHAGTDNGITGIVEVTDISATPKVRVAYDTHTHTWGSTVAVATNNAATVTINANTSESAYPPYVRAIFIQLTTIPGEATLHPQVFFRPHSRWAWRRASMARGR